MPRYARVQSGAPPRGGGCHVPHMDPESRILPALCILLELLLCTWPAHPAAQGVPRSAAGHRPWMRYRLFTSGENGGSVEARRSRSYTAPYIFYGRIPASVAFGLLHVDYISSKCIHFLKNTHKFSPARPGQALGGGRGDKGAKEPADLGGGALLPPRVAFSSTVTCSFSWNPNERHLYAETAYKRD